jgi:hypothetical protein
MYTRFMESLDWVDRTYIAKHKSDDPKNLRAMYYPNLKLYQKHRGDQDSQKKKPLDALIEFLIRSSRRAAISLAVYMASYLPYVGRFVLPAASFYTFRKAVGTQPAVAIFATGVFLPRRYIVRFLQSYFASRSLMRQLVSSPLASGSATTNASSSTPTSLGFTSRPSKSANGIKSAKAFFSASLLASSPCSKYRLSVC